MRSGRVVESLLGVLYTGLQYGLPSRFRVRHGAEMREVVLQRTNAASTRFETVRIWLLEIGDLFATAARLRLIEAAPAGPPKIPDQKGLPVLEQLRFDVRLAIRALSRNPGFCLVVVLTLAVGIGATTTIFSFVNAVLLEPLPYRDAHKLVLVWETDRLTGTQREPASVPDFRDFNERNTVLDGLAAFAVRAGNLTARDADPQQVSVAFTSHNFLDVMGLTPAAGRTFDATEDAPGGDLVVLVSQDFWNGRFNRDPEIIGREVILDDRRYEVIGILPEGLTFPETGIDLLAPLQSPADSQRSRHGIGLVGRLRSGVSVAAAQENFARIAADLEATYPENRARGAYIEPLTDALRGEARPALFVLLGSVLTVLLIACGNVAGLLLARGAARRQEVAVCSALGAGTGQIARRFLLEAVLLTAAGTIAGLLLAALGLRVVRSVVPAELLARFPVELNWPVLLFAVLISIVIALAFGLLPVRFVLGLDLLASLQSARGSSGGLRLRGRRLLVVGQVALAMVLLAGSALLLNSLWQLQAVDPGFRAGETLRVSFRLPTSRYPRDFSVFPRWEEVHEFNRQVLAKAVTLPGVRAAALSTTHPMESGWTNSFVIVGREAEARDQGELKTRLVTEDYLRAVGISVVQGRGFTAADGTDAPPVLLLNEAAVRRYFPEGSALGQQLAFWGTAREVVGIVADVRMHGLREATPPAMYVPLWQTPPTAGETLLLWTAGDPMALVGPVRETIWSIDPELPLYDVATMQETLSMGLARERLTAGLLLGFGATALLLSAIGLHGLLSYLVVLRRHEMGVRMALGASRDDVVRLVLGQGARLVLIGVLIGLPVSLLTARGLEALLFGVNPADPLSFLAAAVLLVAAILAAALLPARRAGRVDPSASLRAG